MTEESLRKGGNSNGGNDQDTGVDATVRPGVHEREERKRYKYSKHHGGMGAGEAEAELRRRSRGWMRHGCFGILLAGQRTYRTVARDGSPVWGRNVGLDLGLTRHRIHTVTGLTGKEAMGMSSRPVPKKLGAGTSLSTE